MGEFDDYKGLFAQSGKFDIPSNFTIGAALRPTDQWLLALDFQRIYYTDSKSVSNPSSLIGNCARPRWARDQPAPASAAATAPASAGRTSTSGRSACSTR